MEGHCRIIFRPNNCPSTWSCGRSRSARNQLTSYLRTTFTVEDGLSSNVVNAILQTRDGFLWIATDAGLNRFDGRHFTPIYFRGPESTPHDIVSALAEGPDGDLWIGTSAGLVRISRQTFDQFDRSLSVFYHLGAGLSDEITCLHVSRDGTLWVGTGAGLYRFVGDQFKTVIPNAAVPTGQEDTVFSEYMRILREIYGWRRRGARQRNVGVGSCEFPEPSWSCWNQAFR
jgi:ligand-binding sensor domain-containing protein